MSEEVGSAPEQSSPAAVQPRVTRPSRTDSSAIIDLRKLSALVEPAPARPTPSVPVSDRTALPTFGGGQLNRPTVPPALTVPAPAPAMPPAVAAPRRAPDTTLLLMAICALALIVVALAAYVVVSGPNQTIIRERVAVAAAPSVGALDPQPASAPAITATPVDEDSAPDTPTAVSLDAAELPPEPAAVGTPRPRARTRTRPTERPRHTATPDRLDPPTRSQPRAGSRADIPAECVIDPTNCGLGTKPAKPIKPPRDTKPERDLPVKLSAATIRTALAKVKANAKSCRAKFGGTAGEQVRVKLTIDGASGRVTKAAPIDPHTGTALGGCVASALKQAQFDRFGASVQGVQYGVRL